MLSYIGGEWKSGILTGQGYLEEKVSMKENLMKPLQCDGSIGP